MSPPLPQTRNIHRSGNISMHGGHLLCPVLRTSSESSNTGSALQRETERRITPETSGKTTVNSIRCLHIGQGAGNVILHPFQIFILTRRMIKMDVKREMLPSTAQNHTWVAELELQWEHEGDTDWVCVRGLDCAVRLTLTCSQLHAFSCQKNTNESWNFSAIKEGRNAPNVTVQKFAEALNSSISSSSESSIRGVKAYLCRIHGLIKGKRLCIGPSKNFSPLVVCRWSP